MYDSVFGKTCQYVQKYTYVKLVTMETEIDMLTQKEEFKRWYIYNINLAAVIMERLEVKLNKP